jgi:hypothetical protein
MMLGVVIASIFGTNKLVRREMIKYERQTTPEDRPDVKMITDEDGVMESVREMYKECELEIPLPDSRAEDGNFYVLIPGNEVGELSELMYDIDNGELNNLVEQWNQEALDKLDNI